MRATKTRSRAIETLDDFELLPADDEGSAPAADLAAAAASVLGDEQGNDPLDEDPPDPMGRSWAFDFEAGRFQRAGGSPAEVSGTGALTQWCLMAIHTTRYAHRAFSDEFGMEDAEGLIGEVDPMVSDFERMVREALLVHDRIADVVDFDAVYDPTTGVLTVNQFTVVTDDDDSLGFGGIELHPGVST